VSDVVKGKKVQTEINQLPKPVGPLSNERAEQPRTPSGRSTIYRKPRQDLSRNLGSILSEEEVREIAKTYLDRLKH